ncbi:hypothetical protein [Planomonospora sp. ID82291]|uniref:hypothetical protein n=1 Tax=Planomonospora sp. ID82291 TaxID=2738136 RepID=UPI0018C4193D|nr:hypothetical protein [Planomonospora sp. ID82291]MBG0818301.1 hypothetical protein [Planomonospora sp. ID82291]
MTYTPPAIGVTFTPASGGGGVFTWTAPLHLDDRPRNWRIIWQPHGSMNVAWDAPGWGPFVGAEPVRALRMPDDRPLPQRLDGAWQVVEAFVESGAWTAGLTRESGSFAVHLPARSRWNVQRITGDQAVAPAGRAVEVTFTPHPRGGSFTWALDDPEAPPFVPSAWEIVWRSIGSMTLLWHDGSGIGGQAAVRVLDKSAPRTLEAAWETVTALVATGDWAKGMQHHPGDRYLITTPEHPAWVVCRAEPPTWENATGDRHPAAIALPYVHVDRNVAWPDVVPGRPSVFPLVGELPGRVRVGEWAFTPEQAEEFAAVIALKAFQARMPDLDTYTELAAFLAEVMAPDEDGDVCEAEAVAEAVVRRYRLTARS